MAENPLKCPRVSCSDRLGEGLSVVVKEGCNVYGLRPSPQGLLTLQLFRNSLQHNFDTILKPTYSFNGHLCGGNLGMDCTEVLRRKISCKQAIRREPSNKTIRRAEPLTQYIGNLYAKPKTGLLHAFFWKKPHCCVQSMLCKPLA